MKIKLIQDLKQNDKIYNVDNYKGIRIYKYLCIHPAGNGKYHILIDEVDEPIRLYYKELETILNKNLNSYKEAQLLYAEMLKSRILFLTKK